MRPANQGILTSTSTNPMSLLFRYLVVIVLIISFVATSQGSPNGENPTSLFNYLFGGRSLERRSGNPYRSQGGLGSEFLGKKRKRAPGSEFLGKRAPGSEFLGKRAPGSEFLGKRSHDELEKRVPGSEFLGKRAPGSEFLGKRAPGSEFLGKRAPGSEFLGKRAPGSEFLGKRAPGSEFLGKRVPGSEFLGKRASLEDEYFLQQLIHNMKRSPEIPAEIGQSDRNLYWERQQGVRR